MSSWVRLVARSSASFSSAARSLSGKRKEKFLRLWRSGFFGGSLMRFIVHPLDVQWQCVTHYTAQTCAVQCLAMPCTGKNFPKVDVFSVAVDVHLPYDRSVEQRRQRDARQGNTDERSREPNTGRRTCDRGNGASPDLRSAGLLRCDQVRMCRTDLARPGPGLRCGGHGGLGCRVRWNRRPLLP